MQDRKARTDVSSRFCCTRMRISMSSTVVAVSRNRTSGPPALGTFPVSLGFKALSCRDTDGGADADATSAGSEDDCAELGGIGSAVEAMLALPPQRRTGTWFWCFRKQAVQSASCSV